MPPSELLVMSSFDFLAKLEHQRLLVEPSNSRIIVQTSPIIWVCTNKNHELHRNFQLQLLFNLCDQGVPYHFINTNKRSTRKPRIAPPFCLPNLTFPNLSFKMILEHWMVWTPTLQLY